MFVRAAQAARGIALWVALFLKRAASTAIVRLWKLVAPIALFFESRWSCCLCLGRVILLYWNLFAPIRKDQFVRSTKKRHDSFAYFLFAKVWKWETLVAIEFLFAKVWNWETFVAKVWTKQIWVAIFGSLHLGLGREYRDGSSWSRKSGQA